MTLVEPKKEVKSRVNRVSKSTQYLNYRLGQPPTWHFVFFDVVSLEKVMFYVKFASGKRVVICFVRRLLLFLPEGAL